MYSKVNFCSKCGSSFDSDASFCKSCGNKRTRETTVDQSNACKGCGELLQSNDKYCPQCGEIAIHSTTMQVIGFDSETHKLKRIYIRVFIVFNLIAWPIFYFIISNKVLLGLILFCPIFFGVDFLFLLYKNSQQKSMPRKQIIESVIVFIIFAIFITILLTILVLD